MNWWTSPSDVHMCERNVIISVNKLFSHLPKISGKKVALSAIFQFFKKYSPMRTFFQRERVVVWLLAEKLTFILPILLPSSIIQEGKQQLVSHLWVLASSFSGRAFVFTFFAPTFLFKTQTVALQLKLLWFQPCIWFHIFHEWEQCFGEHFGAWRKIRCWRLHWLVHFALLA